MLNAETPAVQGPRWGLGRTRASNLVKNYGPAAVLVVLAIAIWEISIRALDVPSYLWPAPSVIVQSMSEENRRSAVSDLGHSQGESCSASRSRSRPAFWSGSSSTSRARSAAPSIRS